MPTIELGELGTVAVPDVAVPDVAGPGTAPSRPAYRRTAVRRARLLTVLVVVLGTTAAGAPWPAPLPEAGVPARLGATVFAERDWLFVADPVGPGEDGQPLAAYRLPDGAPRWRATLPDDGVGWPKLFGDTLVLATFPEPLLAKGGRVTALDVTTGRTSWDRAATLEATSSSGDLMLWTPPEGSRPDAANGGNGAGILAAVDPASGRARWSLPTPPGARRVYDQGLPAGAPVMAVTLPSGRVEIRELATGAVVRATDLPPPGSGSGTRWAGEISGDLFLVHEESSITGYGLTGLDRRWSVGTDAESEFGMSTCGSQLCSYRRNGGVRVWDARTGGTIWADPRWNELLGAGDVLIASGISDPGASGLRYAVDPGTGRVLAELGVWEVLQTPYGAARFIGIRYGPDRQAWLAEIDTTTLRVRNLAVLDQVSGDCGLAGRTLHCRRLDASVGLWRLPG